MNWNNNVIRYSKSRWLMMWINTILNDTIENNYYDNIDQITEGSNCIVRNNTFVNDDVWPAEAVKIMEQAGRRNVLKDIVGPVPVNFPVNVEKVCIVPDTLVLKIGNSALLENSAQLDALVTPANATNKDLIWKSDNPGIAEVSATGVVSVKAIGRATITATSRYGVEKDSCVIIVKAKLDFPDKNSFIVYPNPANWVLTIALAEANKNEGELVTIFDMTGKKISSKPLFKGQSEMNMDVSRLKSGVYFISVLDEIKKVIIGCRGF